MWLKTVHCCHLRLRMKSRYEQGASAPRHPRQRDVRRTSKQRGRLARSCCRRLLRCKSPLGCLLIACDPNRGCQRQLTGVGHISNGYRPYTACPCVSHWTSMPYEAMLCRNPGRNSPKSVTRSYWESCRSAFLRPSSRVGYG